MHYLLLHFYHHFSLYSSFIHLPLIRLSRMYAVRQKNLSFSSVEEIQKALGDTFLASAAGRFVSRGFFVDDDCREHNGLRNGGRDAAEVLLETKLLENKRDEVVNLICAHGGFGYPPTGSTNRWAVVRAFGYGPAPVDKYIEKMEILCGGDMMTRDGDAPYGKNIVKAFEVLGKNNRWGIGPVSAFVKTSEFAAFYAALLHMRACLRLCRSKDTPCTRISFFDAMLDATTAVGHATQECSSDDEPVDFLELIVRVTRS